VEDADEEAVVVVFEEVLDLIVDYAPNDVTDLNNNTKTEASVLDRLKLRIEEQTEEKSHLRGPNCR
jgi:hypothetical protein